MELDGGEGDAEWRRTVGLDDGHGDNGMGRREMSGRVKEEDKGRLGIFEKTDRISRINASLVTKLRTTENRGSVSKMQWHVGSMFCNGM